MVGFGFKPRQLGLSGSQHRAANPCAGRPLSHYRPLLQSVNPSCDGRGTHNSGHLLCFMGLLCVSVSCLGTWYLSDLSIGNVWWMHAFLRLFSARGCLPWSASLVQVPSRPESVFILSFLPPAYHIPPSPLFSPSCLPTGPHLSQLLSSRSLETWEVCFHSLWNMYTLAPLTSSFYIYTLKYSAMKNFGTPVMIQRSLFPDSQTLGQALRHPSLSFAFLSVTLDRILVFASHSL